MAAVHSYAKVYVACLGVLHVSILTYCAIWDSYTWDEIAYVPSGIHHLETGKFAMCRVNPPLVRMIASAPLLFVKHNVDWSLYTEDVEVRPEWDIAPVYLKDNAGNIFLQLSIARLACIPFSLLGFLVSVKWSSEEFGDCAGVVTAALWAFSPTLLAHGHLITPDVAAASFGVAAAYLFTSWLRHPSWRLAVVAGVALGFAESAKTTWLCLYALWPFLWCVSVRVKQCSVLCRDRAIEFAQLLVMFVISVTVLSAWYGFDGCLTPLGQFRFISRTLGGTEAAGGTGNRFTDTMLESVPVPMPREYVQGIDRQKQHFEKRDWSYLRGEWRESGWWYYYIYGALIKEPLGVIALIVVSTVASSVSRQYRATWSTALVMYSTIAAIVVLTSSQTGFNRHYRYLLPVTPFVIIAISRVGVAFSAKTHALKTTVGLCLSISAWSSLCAFPHYIGYFNESVGGSVGGHNHMLSSNTDWGQDLHYLKRWMDSHPEARPISLKWHVRPIDPSIAGVNATRTPSRPVPGWHAVSVNVVRGRDNGYSYFLDVRPVATIGGSIFIYNLSRDDCARLEAQREVRALAPKWEASSSSGCVTCVDKARYRDVVVTGHEDSIVKVWDAEKGGLIGEIECIYRPSMIAISGNAEIVAFTGGDRRVICWSLSRGEQMYQVESGGSVSSIAFSSDSKSFAVTNTEGTVQLRSSQNGEVLWERWLPYPANKVVFNRDDTWVAVSARMDGANGGGGVWKFNTSTGDVRAALSIPDRAHYIISLFSDDGVLIAKQDVGSSIVWAPDGGTRRVLTEKSASVKGGVVIAKNEGAVGVYNDGIMKVWKTSIIQKPLRFRIADDGLVEAAISHNGAYIITGDNYGVVRRWDVVDLVE